MSGTAGTYTKFWPKRSGGTGNGYNGWLRHPDTRVGLFQFLRLRRELSTILGCEVDLATPESLHKELKDDNLKEAVHAA
jgi:hypothetical protein